MSSTCESRGPIVLRDPATLVRSSRRGVVRLMRSVDAGTRNTTSRRPPTHTVDKEDCEGKGGTDKVSVGPLCSSKCVMR